MQKIPTLFKRDFDNDPRYVLPIISPGCEWVLDGQGVATRKYDGTCVMLDEAGRWWARREIKSGKTAPDRFLMVGQDDTTGKIIGWEPIDQSGFYKWWQEAITTTNESPTSGTYELCGPKVNGNPEDYDTHVLISHKSAERLPIFDGLQTFESLQNLFMDFHHEGIVWHHPDGCMAKLKVRDFPAR